MMSKRTRQYIGILFAIIVYYIVHEGAHLIVALDVYKRQCLHSLNILLMKTSWKRCLRIHR